MSLTLGSGPLSPSRAGSFDPGTRVGEHAAYLEPLERRVRGWRDGQPVVDSRAVRLLHRTGSLPTWWFPAADVRDDGELARTSDDPLLDGLVTVAFDALDRWQEEEDEVLGHPRDPYHRVDTRRTADEVVVEVAGQEVARSGRAVKLFETGMPVRLYLPREDVRAGVLSPSSTTTLCPYKGVAGYDDLEVDGVVVPDGAWHYAEPLGEALQVRDHLSFDGEQVRVRVVPAP